MELNGLVLTVFGHERRERHAWWEMPVASAVGPRRAHRGWGVWGRGSSHCLRPPSPMHSCTLAAGVVVSVLWSCCFGVQRVRTETQTKNVKFYSAPRAPQGRAEVLQFHHKHFQGPHTLAGLSLPIARPLHTQNAAELHGLKMGEVVGGPGKD